ncbi:MAG: hypothetical protein WC107_01260 [Patescibacteria group bacterium]
MAQLEISGFPIHYDYEDQRREIEDKVTGVVNQIFDTHFMVGYSSDILQYSGVGCVVVRLEVDRSTAKPDVADMQTAIYELGVNISNILRQSLTMFGIHGIDGVVTQIDTDTTENAFLQVIKLR